MRVTDRFFIVKLVALLIVLTGFSVTSQAGSFKCAICNQTFKNAHKYKNIIKTAQPICINCSKTQSVKVEFDDDLSSAYSQMSLCQKTSGDMTVDVSDYIATSLKETVLMQETVASSSPQTENMAIYEDPDHLLKYDCPQATQTPRSFLTTALVKLRVKKEHTPPEKQSQSKIVNKTGFSVTSQAGSYSCVICNQKPKSKHKYKNTPKKSQPICIDCSKTKNVGIDIDDELSPAYSAISLRQNTADETVAVPAYIATQPKEAISIQEIVTSSSPQTEGMAIYDEPDNMRKYDCPIAIQKPHDFLITILIKLGANSKYIPPEKQAQNKIVKNILSISKSKGFEQLKTQINEIKTHDEIKFLYYLNDICLPDFFVTNTLEMDDFQITREYYLVERKTAETIKNTVKRVEMEVASKQEQSEDEYEDEDEDENVHIELLYFAIKTNQQDHNSVTTYLLIIGTDSSGQDVALYLFDELKSVLYELPGKMLVKFMNFCQQWAVMNNCATGMYSFSNSSAFIQQRDLTDNRFTQQTLQTIVVNFNEHYQMLSRLNTQAVKELININNYTHLFRHLRKSAKSFNQENLADRFVLWYRNAWLSDSKDYKSFALKLLGIKAADGEAPLIIVTQINRSIYAINLLQGDDTYFLFHKSFMTPFAKQLMFISEGIIAYEIMH